MNKYSVPLQQLVEEFNLTVAYRATDFDEIRILVDEVSRPGLPLTGFFEHFEALRMEVLGYVEMTYLDAQSREKRLDPRSGVHLLYHLRSDHLAEKRAGSAHHAARGSGGGLRRGTVHHRRERHRQERDRRGAAQARSPSDRGRRGRHQKDLLHPAHRQRAGADPQLRGAARHRRHQRGAALWRGLDQGGDRHQSGGQHRALGAGTALQPSRSGGGLRRAFGRQIWPSFWRWQP